MSILVTGGCGFIGSNFILDWFSGSREPIINVDKLTYAGNPSNLAMLNADSVYRFVHCGIEDTETIRDILATGEIRAIVNFAAESHVDRSIASPEDFLQTNVLGTLRLLEVARTHHTALAGTARENFRFLHISTDEVYGTLEPDAPPFTEAAPFSPNSPYAASKAASDHLVRSYGVTYGLPVLTTNASNTYGRFQFPEKLIPLVIHNALSGKDLPVYGDGLQVRDWLHVADHCGAIRCVLAQGRPGETYNVGGNTQQRNIDVVRTICAVLDAERPRVDGRSYTEQIAFVLDRRGHDRRYAIDCRKIDRDLGWTPKIAFEVGLTNTVRWYLKNAAWVKEVTSGSYRDWVAQQYAA